MLTWFANAIEVGRNAGEEVLSLDALKGTLGRSRWPEARQARRALPATSRFSSMSFTDRMTPKLRAVRSRLPDAIKDLNRGNARAILESVAAAGAGGHGSAKAQRARRASAGRRDGYQVLQPSIC